MVYDKHIKNLLRKKKIILKNPISSKSKLFVTAERVHIQAHLAITEIRLRIRKSTIGNRTGRLFAMNILHDYWLKGEFPKNTYKKNERNPVFIDSQGTYCAVGYLMAHTGYIDLANDIDKQDKFILVENINDKDVDTWLYDYGLNKNEAALIQPGYGDFVLEKVGYSLQDKIMAVLTIVASIAVIVLVLFMLRLMRNKTVKMSDKRPKLLLSWASIAVLVISFVFFLPDHTTTVMSLTDSSLGNEIIACEGWNTPKEEKPSVCNEFEEKGKVPGWRAVPCDEISPSGCM